MHHLNSLEPIFHMNPPETTWSYVIPLELTCPLLHCTKQGSLEHKAWPGPYCHAVLPIWRQLLPFVVLLHGIGRAPTATLLHMRWVSMHLHRYRGGGGLACRTGFVFTSMSVWHAWYLQGGIDLFRLFVEIGWLIKKREKLVAPLDAFCFGSC